MADIDNTQDVLDSRDVIARFEELELELQEANEAESDEPTPFAEWVKAAAENNAHTLQEAAQEFKALESFLDEMKGNGGDEKWRGNWYPVTLVRESYFEDYAKELAEDTGALNHCDQWPATCIDWEKAANELQMDYTGADFDGVTYYFR